MTFSSPSFSKAVEGIQTRVTNSNTTQQRMSLGNTSTNQKTSNLTNTATNNVSQSDRQSMANFNEGLATNPAFKQSVANNNRDFTEDTRRFNAGQDFKNTSDQRANDTNRFQSSNALEGSKYNADAGVKSTQIGADASRYGADKNLEGNKYNADANLAGTRLQTDASRYGADRGVDQARIGADASRFNALLGAGTSFFNSSQYKPTFNR